MRLHQAAMPCSSLALILAVGASAGCDTGEPVPEAFVAVDEAELDTADLPPALAIELATPVSEDELALAGAIRFEADPDLSEIGNVDGEMTAIERVPSAARFGRDALVAIRWGYFPPSPSDEWKDWSGFVAVTHGQIELVRPLRFENDREPPRRLHEDFVRPAAEGHALRIRSHTRPAWDGVLVRVSRPAFRPSALIVHLGDTTRVLPFEELFELDAAEVVDDAGHELRVRARTPHAVAHGCAVEVGRARGQWGPAEGDDTGLFRGVAGTPDDRHVIAGRTIDVRGPYGRFRGRIGEGEPGEDIEPIGRLGGYYATFTYSPGAGALVGRARAPGEDLRAALLGRWQLAADGTGEFRALLLQRDPACGGEE